MSRNIVRHLRFSKSEYEAISRKAAYLKIPEGRFIRKIAVQGNLKRYDHYHDGYGSSRKPHKNAEKTEQQKEWEKWEKDHKEE